MKNKKSTILFVLIILFFFLPQLTSSNEINTHKSYSQAIQEVKNNEKKGGLFIFSGSWCSPCRQLKNNSIRPLLPVLKQYTIVHIIDVDFEKRVVSEFRKRGIFDGSVPFYILTTRDGKSILRTGKGYKSKSQFISWFSGN